MLSLALLTALVLHADPAKTAEEVKRDAAATVDASKRYANEKKDEFVQRMQARLDAAKADLRTLKTDAKAKTDAAAADLEVRQKQASARLDALGKATGNAWSSLKAGVENAVDDLEQGVQRAKAK